MCVKVDNASPVSYQARQQGNAATRQYDKQARLMCPLMAHGAGQQTSAKLSCPYARRQGAPKGCCCNKETHGSNAEYAHSVFKQDKFATTSKRHMAVMLKMPVLSHAKQLPPLTWVCCRDGNPLSYERGKDHFLPPD